MDLIKNIITSSIGKKILMAITGLCFCMFLSIHLIGNLMLFGGKEYFLGYVENLHKLEPLIKLSELILLFMAIIHVLTGIILFYQNQFIARTVRYAVKKSAGGRTIGSATMPYTGLFLLIFLFLHLLKFHFFDHTQKTVYQVLIDVFSNPMYVVFYLFAVFTAVIHISHGFWSAFQTIGANHPKYTIFIKGLGFLVSLIIGIGFGSIPLYVSYNM